MTKRSKEERVVYTFWRYVTTILWYLHLLNFKIYSKMALSEDDIKSLTESDKFLNVQFTFNLTLIAYVCFGLINTNICRAKLKRYTRINWEM